MGEFSDLLRQHHVPPLMRTALFIAIALALIAVVVADHVDIGVKFKPESCTRKSKAGDQLAMHYTGRLASNDKKFDSSLDRGQPFTFKLGAGQVIKGWDQGLLDMCVGEKRTLRIPASLGYGARGAGASIPPNSDLIFDVELIEFKN